MTATYPTAEQRRHPAFCKAAARRWPMIPFHNGQLTYRVSHSDGSVTVERVPCTECKQVKA